MRKKTVKIIAIVIACLFILGVIAPLFTMFVFAAPTDATLQEYEKKEKSILAEMQKLEEEMNTAGEKVYQLEKALAQTEIELESVSEEISGIEEQENQQMELFKERFAVMYENGTGSFWELIFSADNFADFLDRLVIAKEIAEYDKNVVSSMQEIKENIQSGKNQKESLKAEQSQAKAELESAMTALYQKSADAAKSMQELENDKKAYEQYLKDKEEEERLTKLQAGIAMSDRDADLSKVSAGMLVWPTDTDHITSAFSPNRVNPVSGVVRPHTGTDIGAQQGAPVWAAQGGTVLLAETNGGYGNCVILDHGNGVTTLYGHMSAILVEKGEIISQGDQIGRVGSTGNSTGPHLHFEVIIDSTPVDAMGYF